MRTVFFDRNGGAGRSPVTLHLAAALALATALALAGPAAAQGDPALGGCLAQCDTQAYACTPSGDDAQACETARGACRERCNRLLGPEPRAGAAKGAGAQAQGAPKGTAKAPAAAYAALAHDRATGRTGRAWAQPDSERATRIALDACLAAGGRDCGWREWVRDQCLALGAAPGRTTLAGGRAARRVEAERAAVAACTKAGGEGCRPLAAVCAKDG
jgi:hypothetical protein